MEKIRRKSLHNQRLGYLLLIPSSLVIIVVSIYPLLNGIYLSFTNRHFLKPNQKDFIWFSNYKALFANIKAGASYRNALLPFGDPEFYNALLYSFIYTFGVVLTSYLLGLGLSLMLNKDFKFRGFFRALILIPWVIPSTVAATNWLWVLDTEVGIINSTLKALGIVEKSVLFLADPAICRFMMIVVGLWKAFPFMMITHLAGLQGISKDLYEAARIDGAKAFQSFRKITLPLLKPVSFVAITLMFIWTFNNFENIYLLTSGGPLNHTTTLPIFTYDTAFFENNLSLASAVATINMVIMTVLVIIYLKVLFQDNKEVV